MGTSKSSTTKQENKPPSWAEPLFRESASDALNLYKSGAGGNTYLGSTVAPLSGTTMQGVNQLAQAGQAWNTAGTRPLYQQIGAASVSDPTVNRLNQVAGGVGDIAGGKTGITTEAEYRDILGRAQQPTSAASNLQNYASGANLTGEGNPFYRQRMEKELADTAAQIRSTMSGAGRYGSDVSTQALAESLGQIRLQGLENDWNREQANQFNAVGMIDAANQGALGTQLGAVSGLTGVQGQNIANRLSGAGLQGNLLAQSGALRGAGLDRAMGATNAMAGLDQQNFENRLAGAGATLQAGGILDTQAQKQLQDEIAKFYQLDNEDWSRLGMLQSAAAGAAGPYGTQLATSRQPFNPISAIAPLFSGK